MLHVQLLGEVEAVRDGSRCRSQWRTGGCSRSSRCTRPAARDALAARFWPDTPTARANLRTAVWALRRALGPEALRATRESVALGPAVRDIDDPDRDGEPCPGLDDDWARAARAEHRGRRMARLDAAHGGRGRTGDGRGAGRPAGAR